MPFPQVEFESIDAAQEVLLETHTEDGRAYRTVIWIMVDDAAVYVRSVRGEAGRWHPTTATSWSTRVSGPCWSMPRRSCVRTKTG